MRLSRWPAGAEERRCCSRASASPDRLRKHRHPRPSDSHCRRRTTLAQSGMGKGKKFLIALGIAGAFAGVAIAVDRGVEDSTPSSLGQR